MTQQLYESILESNYQWIKCKLCGDAAHKHSVDKKELFSLVLEKIWRMRDRFTPMPDTTIEKSFRSWVNTMTYRMAIDMRRTDRMRQYMIELDVMNASLHSYEQRIAHSHDADEIMKHIHAAYGDVAYTAIRMLRSGLNVKECAAIMNLSKHTIYKKIRTIKNDIQNLNL